MKSLIISSNSSGGGKTTFTLGLMKALINRGFDVQGYKGGPDYIDSDFHKLITKKESRNLDGFLMGEDGLIESYLRGKGDIGIIEGMMGLYDGKGTDEEFSTYYISEQLGLPIVLILTPKMQSTTLAAELKGLKDFKNANIVGVIFNKVSTKYYKLLKRIVEIHTDIEVLGYVPSVETVKFKSRHLGLVQGIEVEDLQERVKELSNIIENYVDLDKLISYLSESKHKEIDRNKFKVKKNNFKIAIAYDEAFRFYYKENLEMIGEMGDINYFSPLRDKYLPEDIDFLYIGGGYPEVFKEQLSNNTTLLEDIKSKLDKGLNCYAECGGLMYLTESINGSRMVGFLNGKTEMTKSLNNFGYSTITIDNENHKITKSLKINCHEFHKSKVTLNEKRIYKLSKIDSQENKIQWECGYLKKNTLAAYAHVHFFSNKKFLENIVYNLE